jgi:hypothetical protein
VTPTQAALDAEGRRFYTWTGRGHEERFYSVTTIIGLGIPKYGLPLWYGKLVAELAYADVEKHGKRALRRWAKDGATLVKAARAGGAKLERIDETPRGLALRHLKAEPERVRDAAGDRGTAVHEAAEDLVLANVREAARLILAGKELPEWPVAIKPWMDSFVAWLRAYRPRFLATEASGYHRGQAYAGTPDAFVEVWYQGRWVPLCVDYKSGKRAYPEVALQCAANARAEFIGGADQVTEHPVPVVEGTAVLHLGPKGYDFRRLRYDDVIYNQFLYAREVFRWVIEVSKTAIGEPIPQDLEDALAASLEGVA